MISQHYETRLETPYLPARLHMLPQDGRLVFLSCRYSPDTREYTTDQRTVFGLLESRRLPDVDEVVANGSQTLAIEPLIAVNNELLPAADTVLAFDAWAACETCCPSEVPAVRKRLLETLQARVAAAEKAAAAKYSTPPVDR